MEGLLSTGPTQSSFYFWNTFVKPKIPYSLALCSFARSVLIYLHIQRKLLLMFLFTCVPAFVHFHILSSKPLASYFFTIIFTQNSLSLHFHHNLMRLSFVSLSPPYYTTGLGCSAPCEPSYSPALSSGQVY